MKKTKKKTLIITIILVVIVLALAVSTFFIIKSMNNSNNEEQTDSEGVVGRISSGWDTGISKPNDSSQSGVQIPGYSMAEMNEGDTQLHLSIGNPKENTCGFYATLELEDGTVLYKSELLEPGCGLTEVPLTQTLKKGKYDAVVRYDCVTLGEKHNPLNSARSKFTLVVN